jgi:hypothetical protein
LPIEVLLWLYEIVLDFKPELKPVSDYFEPIEIKSAETYQIGRIKAFFPLRLKILDKPNPNHDDFLMSLPISFINNMQENGLIQLRSEMQRESVITTYNGVFVSHISFNPERSKKIQESMSDYSYRSDMIRLILIIDGEEDYYFEDDELIIKSGNIALIDGNHRVRAAEEVLMKNPDNELKLPLMFTIGTINDGKFIISQSEKRQPINKSHAKTYDNSDENEIVRLIITSSELDRVYKFAKTEDQIRSGYGFILETAIANNVKNCYNITGMSKKQKKKLADWLVEFLNELADYFNQDFRNFNTVKKTRWSAYYYTFAGYIYLSSILYEKDNWEDMLVKVLDMIDFGISSKPWGDGARNADKLVEQFFERMVKESNVLG